MIKLFIKNILYNYTNNDIENFIIQLICKNHNINKNKLFNLINQECNNPSVEIKSVTYHYNMFINLTRLLIVYLIINILIFGITGLLLVTGFISLLILLCYQYYIDKRVYLIYKSFLSRIT